MTVNEQVTLAIKVVDEVSATAKQMQASAEEARQSVDALDRSMESASATATSAREGLDAVVTEARQSVPKVTESAEAMEDAVTDAMRDARAEVQRTLDSMDGASIGSVDVDGIGIREAVDAEASDARIILDGLMDDSARTRDRVTADGARVQAVTDAVEASSAQARAQVASDSAAMQRDILAVQTKAVLELSTLMAVKESVSAVTGGIVALGLVSDETAKDLMQVNAGFQLVAGAATGLKALQTIMVGLNAQTAINASLNTFLSVVRNHALGMAAVGAGLGAMAGVAGMYLYTNNQNTKNVSIEVQGGSDTESTASQIYQIVNGGAL